MYLAFRERANKACTPSSRGERLDPSTGSGQAAGESARFSSISRTRCVEFFLWRQGAIHARTPASTPQKHVGLTQTVGYFSWKCGIIFVVFEVIKG